MKHRAGVLKLIPHSPIFQQKPTFTSWAGQIPRWGFWELEFRGNLTIVTAYCACKFKLKPSKAAFLALSHTHTRTTNLYINQPWMLCQKKKKKRREIKFRKLTAKRRPKSTKTWSLAGICFSPVFFFFFLHAPRHKHNLKILQLHIYTNGSGPLRRQRGGGGRGQLHDL